MRSIIRRAIRLLVKLPPEARNLGFVNFARYRLVKHLKPQWAGTVRSKMALHPLCCRIGTSDFDVFERIFVARKYQCLHDLNDVQFVVDCGANCGFSSAYLLSQYRTAFVTSIEPDPANFRQLMTNLSPYEPRFRAVNAAIWSHKASLVAVPFLDNREWSRSYSDESEHGNAVVSAISMHDVIASSPFERISILKIDIEGAEKALFGEGSEQWLGLVDNIVIELHGRECENVFMRSIRGQKFEISRSGELTIAKRSEV